VVIEIEGETSKQEGSFGEKAKDAGVKLGATIKNAFSLVGNRFRKADKPEDHPGKPEYNDIAKELVKPKPAAVNESDIDPNDNMQDLPPKEPIQPVLKTNGPRHDSTLPAETRTFEKLEVDCFTCENLITCEVRNLSGRPKRQAENGKCCSHRKEE